MTTRVMRAFLWMAVLGHGVALGAELFDLVVVAGERSAAPPAPFTLLSYGSHYRIDPGGSFLAFSTNGSG
jgi:hypothetical protein